MKNIRVFLTLALCMAASVVFAQDFYDNFEVRRLDTEHFHLLDNDETIVNMGTRGITLMSKGDSPANSNIVYYDATDKSWEAEINMTLNPTSEGGLVLMADRNNYWGVTADYKNIYVRKAGEVVQTVKNPYGRCMRIRLTCADGKLTVATAASPGWKVVTNGNPGYQRKPATSVKVLGTLDVKDATRIAMTASQKNVVYFRDFWYTKK